MNRIYKVIWNKARNAYIVVSEFAKGYARNTTRSRVTRSVAILRLAVLLVCTTSFLAVGDPLGVQAATVNAGTTKNGDANTLAVGNGSSATEKGALAVGGGSQASGDTAVALAWGSRALSDYAIAIGHSAQVGGSYTYAQDGSTSGIRGTAQNAIAIGNTAVANGKDDVVIGMNNTAETPTASYVETNKTGAYAQGGRVIVGHDNSINGRSGNSMAIGSANAVNAVHGIAIGQNVQSGQTAGTTGTKVDGTSTVLEYENSMVIGVNSKALSSNSIALGNGAVAGNERKTNIDTDHNGKGAIAIGETAQATGYYSLGLGAVSQSTGDRTVALGYGTQASEQLATALGSGASASGARSTVVGEEASATATRAIAVGAKSKADGRFAVAIGEEADGSGENGTAVGPEAKAQGKNSVAAGYQAAALSEGEIAIGTSAGNGDNRSNVNNAVSIGTSAHAREAGGVALGNAALANLEKSVAIGDSAKANNVDSIAIGSGATASGSAGSIALGSNSSVGRASGATGGPRWSTSNDIGGRWYTWASAKNSTKGTDGTWTTTIDPQSTVWQSNLGAVSIGTDGLSGTTYTRQLTGLAAGTQDTDAVNVAQWKNTMLATIGDAKEDSTNTRYGSDGVARNVTRLVDEYLTLTGAADDGTTLTKDQLTTDANIGTMVGDNKITFRLAKDLKGLDSVTTGNTKMESSGLTITNTDSKKTITVSVDGMNIQNGTSGAALTTTNLQLGMTNGTGGINLGNQAGGGANKSEGNYLTGLSNTAWDAKNIANGRAATENQLKAVSDSISDYQLVANPDAAEGKYTVSNGKVDLKVKDSAHPDAAVNTVTIEGIASQDEVNGKTFGLADDNNTTVSKILDNAIQVKGDNKAISTSVDNGALKISLKDNISIGQKGADGKDGSIGINGKDGSSVVINGKDGISIKGADGKDAVSINGKDGVGHIGLTGPKGADGSDGTSIDISTDYGTKTLNSDKNTTVNGVEKASRIMYTDAKGTHEVATMDDGQVYGGDTGTAFKRYLNQQANVKGGITEENKLTTADNIGVVSDGTDTLKVRLAKDLKGLDSVTTGNTVVNNGGITINNKVSLTDSGLNNGGNKITNVGKGDVSDISTDAVNGSQLNEVKTLAGKHTKVTVEGGTEAGTDTYAGSSLKLKATTTDGQTTYDLKLGDDISVGKKGADGKDGSIGVNGKDGSAVVINGKDGSIGLNGKDGANGLTIKGSNGSVGVDGTDGYDGKDGMTRIVYEDHNKVTHEVATLDDGLKFGGDFGNVSAVKLNKQVNVKGNAKKETDLTDGNIGVVSSQDGDNGQLLIKLNKDLNLTDKGSVTIGGITLKQGAVSMGGNQMANVASGTTGKTWDATTQGYDANWNNAANVGDVKKAIDDIKGKDNGGFGLTADDGQSVKQDLGKNITVAGDGKNIETKVADGKLQIGLKKDVDLGPDGSIKTGDTTINKDGVETNKITIKDSSISIDKDGINAGNTVIKNVASGIVNNNDTDNSNAANIGDVKKIAGDAADSVKAKSGKNITVNNDNTINLNDHITMGDQNDASHKVDIDGTKGTITAGDKVSLDGSKGTGTIGGVTIGSQTAKTNLEGDKAKTESGNFVTGLDNKTWNPSENGIVSGRAATEDQLKVVDDKLTKGRVFQGDDGESNKVTVGLGDTLKLAGGANALNLSDGNIGVVKNSAGDGLDVKLSKNISGLDSVTTGNTVINNSGLTVKTSDSSRTITVQDGNVNMGKNVVTGVADGKIAPGSTDAVNGGQLAQRDEVIDNIGGEINKLGNRVNHVGAGAAALAALHPLDFDPDDKWDFAAGYGNYRGANAAAVGAYYRPNEDTMLSVGGSFGGGENMVNAGVSFKLGQGNHVSTSRVAMAKEIKDLRKEIEGLRSALADVAAGNRLDPTKTKLFPDIPQNHWAYNEIAQLYGNGIVKGYPDGNFGGDRMMTRYEFAMMVYRQMQRGAALSDRIVNEFEPELERIRVDTITKDKDGNPVIQRVRVIKDRG